MVKLHQVVLYQARKGHAFEIRNHALLIEKASSCLLFGFTALDDAEGLNTPFRVSSCREKTVSTAVTDTALYWLYPPSLIGGPSGMVVESGAAFA